MTGGAILVDTFYWLALINPNDQWHDRAVRGAAEVHDPLVTTEAVLLEVGDALCRRQHRAWAVDLIAGILAGDDVETVPMDADLFTRGFELYRERPDKDWSLTDCISFVVMTDRDIDRALTGDIHFVQAGFAALLRDGA